MDTRLSQYDDFRFYRGFEGETEVIFTNGAEHLHVWEGYLHDLLRNPPLDGLGWYGLTRDYHQMEGPFAFGCDSGEVDSAEYLRDLKTYAGKQFQWEETGELLSKLMELFQMAVNRNEKVKIEVI